MSVVSDLIEEFILSVMTEDQPLQLSRNELASYFSVAPSQINYVLSTRFGVDKGYVIESRRGGGGYITIMRVSQDPTNLLGAILQELDALNGLTFNKAVNILDRLMYEKIIEVNEANIIKSAISDKALANPLKSEGIRKNVFREIILGIMRR